MAKRATMVVPGQMRTTIKKSMVTVTYRVGMVESLKERMVSGMVAAAPMDIKLAPSCQE